MKASSYSYVLLFIGQYLNIHDTLNSTALGPEEDVGFTHSAGLFPFMVYMCSVPGDGLSRSPASRGSAALHELFSSDDDAELWERWGTWRLRS